MSIKNLIASVTLLLASALSYAEPATYSSDVAPTFDPPSAPADGFRLYQGCDLGTQSLGALIDGNYASGKAYSFSGDTESPPTLCIVAFNSEGEGSYDVAWTLNANLSVPGPVINLNPGNGCQAVAGSANVYSCNITVITN